MSRAVDGGRVMPSGAAPRIGQRPVGIVLVTAPGCHFCDHAESVLDGLSNRFPLSIRRIDLGSPEGARLIRESRTPFPPVLVIEGRVFGYGRVSARKLEREIAALVGTD